MVRIGELYKLSTTFCNIPRLSSIAQSSLSKHPFGKTHGAFYSIRQMLESRRLRFIFQDMFEICGDISTIVCGIATSRAPSTLADGRRGKQDPEHHPPLRMADPTGEEHEGMITQLTATLVEQTVGLGT